MEWLASDVKEDRTKLNSTELLYTIYLSEHRQSISSSTEKESSMEQQRTSHLGFLRVNMRFFEIYLN